MKRTIDDVKTSLPSRERGLKSDFRLLAGGQPVSLPSRERGLKLRGCQLFGVSAQVAPFTGAWIEINLIDGRPDMAGSLPSRERGLKFTRIRWASFGPGVAPFTGAWIEIPSAGHPGSARTVAPFTGAWIEISTLRLHGLIGGRRSLHGSVD